PGRTGRRASPAAPDDGPSAWATRSSSPLFRRQVPRRQAPGPPPDLPPPERHVPDVPAGEHDRQQEEQGLRHDERDDGEDDRDDDARADRREPEAAHLAQDRLVLLGRDLSRVPAAAAALAFP